MFPYEDSKTLPVRLLSVRTLRKKNHSGFVNICPTLVIDTSMETSSRVPQHGNPRSWIFKKKFEIEFCPYPEERNTTPYSEERNPTGFVNISPTLVIDTSMERVFISITTWKPKKVEFKKKSKLSVDLNFDLCQRAEIVQVGLNMNLYDDIGDASSSIRGSTSSFYVYCYSLLET